MICKGKQMKNNLKLSLVLMGLMASIPAVHGSGIAKYQGKELVTQKDVDAKIKELKLEALPRDQVFMHLLVQMAEERMLTKLIKDSRMESDSEFQRVAKLNAEEFKRSYYMQKEARKRITPQMRQMVYEQIKASVKDKKEVRPRVIVLTDEKTANEVYGKIKKGESFADLAKVHSIDQTTKDKGGIGDRFLPEESFPAELIAEFSSCKEGVASKPIKTNTPSGIVYIISMVEAGNRRFMQVPPIDSPEIAGQIEQIITRQMMNVVQADLSRQLEVYDLSGNKVPLVPEQEAKQEGMPLINGGVKKQ